MTAEQLREARKAAGLSMKQAAEYSNTPYRSWQDWEMGRRRVPGWASSWMALWVNLMRDIPADLMSDLKMRAARDGSTIREILMEAAKKYLEGE